ncbi:hypothetical protein MVEN_00226000 [Mycena venus]|uniref:Uncharacterized protein n=1 Tax=Mycena venus TaxID=2733690 RepID=A0A8H7DB51_9AGAR|nr:hypothetical protein MVEN_00226000 [Mycena venus]
MPVFSSGRNFRVDAAEINNVHGTIRRVRSPTTVTFGASSTQTGSASHDNGPAMNYHRYGTGMFEGSTDYYIRTARIDNVTGLSENIDSPTTVSFGSGEAVTTTPYYMYKTGIVVVTMMIMMYSYFSLHVRLVWLQ